MADIESVIAQSFADQQGIIFHTVLVDQEGYIMHRHVVHLSDEAKDDIHQIIREELKFFYDSVGGN